MTGTLFRAPTREPKHVRRSRARIARYADLHRRATDPKKRYGVARDALLSAIQNTRRPSTRNRHAYQQRVEWAEHVTDLIERADLSADAARLYHARLAERGDEPSRLSLSLMCLGGVIGRLPDAERETVYDYYARYLIEAARRVETEGR